MGTIQDTLIDKIVFVYSDIFSFIFVDFVSWHEFKLEPLRFLPEKKKL